nr:hypothetical protein [Tanacetum cinerariifolium]
DAVDEDCPEATSVIGDLLGEGASRSIVVEEGEPVESSST